MAQPAMAITGSAARRASDFPTDNPAILIAAPSPGGTGDCHAAPEKSHTAFPVRLLLRPPLYGSPLVNNHPEQKWFHTTSTILRWRRDRDGIADTRRLHCRAVTGLERRNNNNGETTEMPTVIWDHVHLR